MWKLLKFTSNWGNKKASDIDLDPDIINAYFAEIATDPMYNKADIIWASRSQKEDSIVQSCPIYYHRDVIEVMLAKVQKTSPGNDEIPYWVYRDCTRGLANVVTKIINFSLSSGGVPSAWRVAAITPVSKNNLVLGPNDLRPISVTPILSRLVERMVVRDMIISHIPPVDLTDQIGFKPSRSTEAALIDLTHTISVMLENNKYVRCLMIDFSKALTR